jgi:hypothetical protein
MVKRRRCVFCSEEDSFIWLLCLKLSLAQQRNRIANLLAAWGVVHLRIALRMISTVDFLVDWQEDSVLPDCLGRLIRPLLPTLEFVIKLECIPRLLIKLHGYVK